MAGKFSVNGFGILYGLAMRAWSGMGVLYWTIQECNHSILK